MQRERLTNDFTTALNQFQRVQRDAVAKERESVQRVRNNSGRGGGGGGGPLAEGSGGVMVDKLGVDMDAIIQCLLI